MMRDETRGWYQLFNTLKEAMGYAYLQREGCTEVAFIKDDRQH